MAEGILVGTARVLIAPDMRGFLSKLQTELKTELAALNTDVPVKFTVDKDSVAKAQAELGPLVAGKAVPLKFKVDPASVAAAKAALGPMAGRTVPVKFTVDPASAAKAKAALGPMAGRTVPVKFTVDKASLAAARAAAQEAVSPTSGGGGGEAAAPDPATVALNDATARLAGATIGLDTDTRSLIITSDQLLQATRALNLTTISLVPVTSSLERSTDSLTGATKDLTGATRTEAAEQATGAGQGGKTTFAVDNLSLARDQGAARDQLGLLPGGTIPLNFDINPGSLAQAIGQFRAATGLAAGGRLPLSVDFDYPSLTRAMAAFRAATGIVHGGGIPLNVVLNQTSLARAQAQFRAVTGTWAGTVPLNVALDRASVARTQTELEALAAAEKVAAAQAPGLADADAAIAGASKTVTDALGAETKAIGLNRAAWDFLLKTDSATRIAGLNAARNLLLSGDDSAKAAGMSLGQRVLGDAGAGGGGGLLAGMAANRASGGGGGRGGFGGFGRFGWLGGTIGGVKTLHVALDATAEAAIAVGLALAAATAGVAAMVNATQDLVTHWTALTQVGDSFGTHLKPITGSFDALNKAMAPQTIEAYGGALRAVESNTGAFNDTARQVVTIFDDWIAKIDIWVKASGGFGSLLHSGIGYLTQFGQIIGTFGQALGNLLKEDPGIARFLLDIVQGAATLLKLFTELPKPIVETTFALHGLWLWSKVLSVPLLGAARSMGFLSKAQVEGVKSATSFANILKFVVTNPWGWVAAAAAAVGYFTYEASQGTPAARKFIDTINQRISTENASTAIVDIGTAIGQLNDKIKSTTTGGELLQMQSGGFWTSAGKYFSQGIPNYFLAIGHAFENYSHQVAHGGIVGAAKGLGGIFEAIFGNAPTGAEAARIDISKYNAAIDQLLGKQKNLFTETGNLITSGRSYSQSLALMDLAGVRAGDKLDVMAIKVANLVRGYKAAGIQAGLLGNSVNAVTFATLQQQSSISKVTGGWDAFFKTVSGGETGFSQFAQQLASLNKDMSGAGSAAAQSHLTTAQGRVASAQSNLNSVQKTGTATSGALTAAQDRLRAAQQNLTAVQSKYGSAAKATNVSLGGLNSSSIAARVQFQQTITTAQQQADNLMTLASAAGDGTKGYHLLTAGVKGLVAALLPAAKGNKAATAELYALAQQGGYPAADSFKQLSEWAGKPATGLARTDKATSTLTVDAAGLARDVKRLSTALGTTLTGAMSSAIFLAHGGQKSFNDFANAMAHHSIGSKAVADATKKVGNTLIGTLHNVNDARRSFETFAEGMGATQYQAKVLWDTFRHQPFSATGNKINNVQQQIADLARKLGISKTAATELWQSMHQGQTQTSSLSKALQTYDTDIRNNTQNTDAGKGARAQLIKDLEKTGLTAGQAKTDVNNLTGALKKIPPTEGVYISMRGKGQFSIHQQGAFFQGESGHARQGGSLLGASGAFVHAGTTATADDVLARVSKGELIVPAKMVSAGLVDHLRGAIPGFAGGGFVEQGNKNVLNGQYATSMVNKFTSDMTGAMESAMKTAAASAASAAASGFGIPGAVAATGPAQSIARRLLASMGWSDQWPALDLLWTRESGWRWNAANPSGAYGIPQSLPADKMASAGADWRTNPETQIRWGLGYIRSVYGGPDNAWAHEISHGWYDKGGVLPPGLTLAANLTGKPEVVLSPSQLTSARQHGGGGGNTYIAQFPDEWAAAAMESRVRQAFTAMSINAGRQARIGRNN